MFRGFLEHGQVHRDDLRPHAASLGVDLDEALKQLSSADLVHSASDGHIDIAYPFSRRHTGHAVQVLGHHTVSAMCAIDALGILVMTGVDGVVDSTDPATGSPIRVHRRNDEWTWHPASAVVVVAQTRCVGTVADTLCGSITFHTDQAHAKSYLENHSEIEGHVLSQDEAIALADIAFRCLLDT